MNMQNISKTIEALESDARISALFLFGSTPRGEAGPLSDIDLAAFLSETVNPADYLAVRLELMSTISSLLASESFDLVIMNEAAPGLVRQIDRYGTRLSVADPERLAAFLERSLDLYLDFEPYARTYNRELRERIRNGGFGA